MPNTSTIPTAFLKKSFLFMGLVSVHGSETIAALPEHLEIAYDSCKLSNDDTRTIVIENDQIVLTNVHIPNCHNSLQESEVLKSSKDSELKILYDDITSHITNEKVKTLFDKFRYEQEIFPNIITIDFEKAAYRFLNASTKISDLEYKEVFVQLKDDNAFKFNLYFDNEIELMLTFCFDPNEDLGENEMFYSLFKDDEVISAGIYEIDKFVEAFPKYL